MKKGWEIKKLGEICKKITDGSHNPPKGVVSSDFMMLSSKNIYDDLIHFEDPRYLTQNDFEIENKRTDVQHNDILLTIVGTIGRVAVVSFNHPKFTLQRSVAVLKIKEEIIDSRFLMYSLQNILKFLSDEARGVAQKGIYLNQLKSIEIPLPSLPEQQRIVAILDEAFAAIAKAKANAEQNLKNAKELFESYLQGVFEQKGDGWEEKTLGDILEEMMTGPFGSMLHKSDYVENGIPVVNPQNIINGKILPLEKTMISDITFAKLKKYALKEGDIVMARRGEMGRCALVKKENTGWLCGTGSVVIRINKMKADQLFLNTYLSSSWVKAQLEKASTGATMSNLNQSILSEIRVNLPPLKEQQFIVQKLDALSAQTKKLEAIYQQKINDLEELKKSILQKAFSGELKTAEMLAV